MDRKLDLSSALQRRIVGNRVTVQLNKDIAGFLLSDLMQLDDMGADFVGNVSDTEAEPDFLAETAKPQINLSEADYGADDQKEP